MRNKFVDNQRHEIAYEDALKVCCEEGAAFNPIMLEHKIQNLTPPDMIRIFEATLVKRIKKYGKIAEIIVDVPEDKIHYLYDLSLRKKGILDRRGGKTQ